MGHLYLRAYGPCQRQGRDAGAAGPDELRAVAQQEPGAPGMRRRGPVDDPQVPEAQLNPWKKPHITILQGKPWKKPWKTC